MQHLKKKSAFASFTKSIVKMLRSLFFKDNSKDFERLKNYIDS